MKFLVPIVLAMCAISCGSNEPVTAHRDAPIPTADGGSSDGAALTCSSSSSGDSLQCTSGQVLPLPPTFPHSTECNQCLTHVLNNVASVECPNGLNFSFTIVAGANGTNGSSCSTTTDGWVRCTDGTSYKLLSGPKGDKGDTGATGSTGATGTHGTNGLNGKDGGSCHAGKNSLGQNIVSCDDGTVDILDGCGGDGCWSYGAKGNVYTLPNTTTTLPDLTVMTPEESVIVPQFDIFDRTWSLGYPGLPLRTEWFGILYQGYIETQTCTLNKCWFRVTSDDGAKLYIDNLLVVTDDGLHPPTAATGNVLALPGWHTYKLMYFQGPRTEMALALEYSTDGTTWNIVPQDQLKFVVTP